ncbi:hypothetical protein [Wenling frogfish filovirus]|uniref:Uncharacterized protein n=1 Tax=Wenling frogfish filovirus TaxID=2116487 RepID=A0A2P1GML6_9MONO|nr:hypothetical protein KM519_gp02 [Wenling frogfish filovirus]AVM87233.1 hypothetical protein [Wenling frogfish filovirus]
MDMDTMDLSCIAGSNTGGENPFQRLDGLPALQLGTISRVRDLEATMETPQTQPQPQATTRQNLADDVYAQLGAETKEEPDDQYEGDEPDDYFSAIETIVGSCMKGFAEQLNQQGQHLMILQKKLDLVQVGVAEIEQSLRASTVTLADELKTDMAVLVKTISQVSAELKNLVTITGPAAGTADAVVRCLSQGRQLPDVPCVISESSVPTIQHLVATAPPTRSAVDLGAALDMYQTVEEEQGENFGRPVYEGDELAEDICSLITTRNPALFKKIKAEVDAAGEEQASRIYTELLPMDNTSREAYIFQWAKIQRTEKHHLPHPASGNHQVTKKVVVMKTPPGPEYMLMNRKPTKRDLQEFDKIVKYDGQYFST